MTTNTGVQLMDRLSQRIGDYLSSTVTTALAATTSLVDTGLAAYTARDDEFNRQWVYVTSAANIGNTYKITDYVTATTTATVANAFASDGANKATYEIHRFDPRNKYRALNMAARALFPTLFRNIRDLSLTGCNLLPNGHFEDWTSSSYPDYWTRANVTAVAETTTIRGQKGTSSVYCTASAGNGYLYISSSGYPRLLDIAGKTISLRVWAMPEVANDISINISTYRGASVTQSLTSTTTAEAGYWTEIVLENQTINEDVNSILIKFIIATNAKYCYLDNARLVVSGTNDYMLPLAFQSPQAVIDRAYYHLGGAMTYNADSMQSDTQRHPIHNYTVTEDGTYRYLHAPGIPEEAQILLVGRAPLESNLSTTTSTMTIVDPYIDLLVEYAASKLFELESGLPSSMDRNWLMTESEKYRRNALELARTLRMPQPQALQKFDWRLL